LLVRYLKAVVLSYFAADNIQLLCYGLMCKVPESVKEKLRTGDISISQAFQEYGRGNKWFAELEHDLFRHMDGEIIPRFVDFLLALQDMVIGDYQLKIVDPPLLNTNASLVLSLCSLYERFLFYELLHDAYLLQHSYQVVEEILLYNLSILPVCYCAELYSEFFIRRLDYFSIKTHHGSFEGTCEYGY
jgi:hypothetical protein